MELATLLVAVLLTFPSAILAKDEDGDEEGDAGDEEEDKLKRLWNAHGLLMGIAWGIFVPLAVASSVFRNLLPLPPGAWFTIHIGLNSLAAVFTIIGFGLAVHAINVEDGRDAKNHFIELPHRKVGLAVFLAVVVQVGIALFRPHPPKQAKIAATEKKEATKKEEKANDNNEEEGEEEAAKPHEEHHHSLIEEVEEDLKTTIRFLWEIKHRLFGVALLGMAWYNVDSGIDLYAEEYGEKENLIAVFWGVVGALTGVIMIGYIYNIVTKK